MEHGTEEGFWTTGQTTKAGSVVGMELESQTSVEEKGTLSRLLSIMDNEDRLLHTTFFKHVQEQAPVSCQARPGSCQAQGSFVPRAI